MEDNLEEKQNQNYEENSHIENQDNENQQKNENVKSETDKKSLFFLHPNSKNSVLEEAKKTYIHIENNEYIGNATGYVTEIGDYMPCMCKYEPSNYFKVINI